ncbi:MAG: hypothetical protein JWO59_574 [Chloroflexi bacterium]|nr:hypothetical protein [Chloroflexota bacterium]
MDVRRSNDGGVIIRIAVAGVVERLWIRHARVLGKYKLSPASRVKVTFC